MRGTLLDKRTDIWAFGCVLTEMLSGRRVFAGDTVPDAIAVDPRTRARLDLLPAGTPLAVRRLLQRCLEKDVKQRLRDIGDVPADIDHVLTDLQAPTSGVVSIETPAAHPRSFRRLVAMVALALLAITAVAAGIWRMASSRSRDAGVPSGLDAADELPRLGRPAVALAGRAHAHLHSRAGFVHDPRSGVRQDAARRRAEAADQRQPGEDESRVLAGRIADRLHHGGRGTTNGTRGWCRCSAASRGDGCRMPRG